MKVNGFEIIGDWNVSNIGKTAIATRGDKKYFLKSYGEYKLPRRADVTEKTFVQMTEKFESFKNNRIAINTALASFAGSGGNIMLPQQWFVHDINYIEATEFVENVLPSEDIPKLPRADLLFIMKTAAGAMFNIHRKNIVHSDLKLSNVLVARNTMGKLVAKIIDFDRSYFINDIRPNDIGGDQAFMSPELTLCFVTDMAEDSLKLLSPKSDVFSLGLVFHQYLTGGEFPKVETLYDDDGKEKNFAFCGEAALHGAKLTLSEKIGKPYLAHLIANMLQLQPEDRPDSLQVLTALKEEKVLPLKEESTVEVPACLRVGGKPFVAPTPKPTTTPEPTPKKEESAVSVDKKESKVEEKPAIPVGYCEPWDCHAIRFDKDKMREFDYVASERYESGAIKCYRLYNSKGSIRVFNVNTLKLMRMAYDTAKEVPTKKEETFVKEEEKVEKVDTAVDDKSESVVKKPVDETTSKEEEFKEITKEVASTGEMWPSDRIYEMDLEAVKEAGYIGLEKATNGGKECYALILPSGIKRNINISALKIMKLVKIKK